MKPLFFLSMTLSVLLGLSRDSGFPQGLLGPVLITAACFSFIISFKYLGFVKEDFFDRHEITKGIERYDISTESRRFFLWLGFNFLSLFLIAQFVYGAELERLLDLYRIYEGYDLVSKDFPGGDIVYTAMLESIFSVNDKTLHALLFASSLSGAVGLLALAVKRWRKEHEKLVLGFRSLIMISFISWIAYLEGSPKIKTDISECTTTTTSETTNTQVNFEAEDRGWEIDKGVFTDKLRFSDGLSETQVTGTRTTVEDLGWFARWCEDGLSSANSSKNYSCESYRRCAGAVAVNSDKNPGKALLSYSDVLELFK